MSRRQRGTRALIRIDATRRAQRRGQRPPVSGGWLRAEGVRDGAGCPHLRCLRPGWDARGCRGRRDRRGRRLLQGPRKRHRWRLRRSGAVLARARAARLPVGLAPWRGTTRGSAACGTASGGGHVGLRHGRPPLRRRLGRLGRRRAARDLLAGGGRRVGGR
eukprot:1033321-Prymnesium_polylepis.1